MSEKNSGGGQPDKKSGWALCRLLREGFWRLNLMLVYGIEGGVREIYAVLILV